MLCHVKKSSLVLVLVIFCGLMACFGTTASAADRDDYVVLGWNNLGMHCINPSYDTLALLPPFNNLWVQVIKRGNPPADCEFRNFS